MAVRNLFYLDELFKIHYDIVNPSCEHCIVFLHGWGSNKDVMRGAFGSLLKNFRHIYLDLPGFGKTPNNRVLSTKDYAHIVDLFLKDLIHHTSYTVVGHSFGGKVALLLHSTDLVLLSSAGIIEPKPWSTKIKIMFAKIMKMGGLGSLNRYLRSHDVQNMSEIMYQTFKGVVDEDFTSYFRSCDKKSLIFWGEQDKATSIGSGQIINGLIKNSQLFIYEGDHYFFIQHAADIARKMEYALR